MVPCAAQAAGGPGAVGDADEDGAGLGLAAGLPELQHEREEGRVDEPGRSFSGVVRFHDRNFFALQNWAMRWALGCVKRASQIGGAMIHAT